MQKGVFPITSYSTMIHQNRSQIINSSFFFFFRPYFDRLVQDVYLKTPSHLFTFYC